MTRTITDRQGREWECSIERGVIVARRGGRTRVYKGSVGFKDLPSEDELTEIVWAYDFGRQIEDEDGNVWLVTSEGRGGIGVDREAGRPQFVIVFDQMNGEGRHWRRTEKLEDLDEYSDEKLRAFIGEA